MLDFNILKKVALKSVILGGIIGILTLIPYLNFFSFLCLLFLVGPIVLIYAHYNNILGVLDTKEGAIWGAISGICAFSGFFVTFCPIAALLGIFIKHDIYMVMKLFFTSGGGIVILILSFFMIGMIVALFNAFSGTAASYLYHQLKK